MKINVIITEDDPNMRQVIKKVVEKVKDVQVIGEANNGIEAIKLIEELMPQVVFLDIDLPEINSIELAQKIFNINSRTFIIFATSFSENRNEFLDVYAFDYLIKPLKLDKLRLTVEKIKLIVEGGNTAKQTSDFNYFVRPTEKKLLFRDDNEYVFLNPDDIIFITKESRKTCIYYTDGMIKTDEKLSIMEK